MKEISILIIHTGGTIGMIQDHKTGALTPIHFENLYETVPTLKKFELKLDIVAFDDLIDSSNVNINFWLKLADIIEKNYNQYDGFVVLHGTDTMSYSASALSYMLENLGKPVVFTGSQLPLGIIRTDGRENFIDAIEFASAYKKGSPLIPEVAVCFENQLLRGNRTNKISAENFDAFLSGNYPPLADVGVNIRYNMEAISKPSGKDFRVNKDFSSDVAILKIFPGISENVVRSILNIPNLKGVVMETYGSGNAPTYNWFIDSLKEAIAKDILILNVTQCKRGSVIMGKYETSVEMSNIGVLSGADMTTESAVTKMMFVLGQKISREEMKKQLTTSLRGEMTVGK